LENISEKMRLIVIKKEKAERKSRETIRKIGEQKRDEFWEKINKCIGMAVEENFFKILREIKAEAENGKKEALFNLGKEKEERYDARDSKTMLNEICAEEIRKLGTGKGMDIEYCFNSVFKNPHGVILNLLAEKLIDLIKREGFGAQKQLDKYTETGGWEDMSGPSFTWHRFNIKINW